MPSRIDNNEQNSIEEELLYQDELKIRTLMRDLGAFFIRGAKANTKNLWLKEIYGTWIFVVLMAIVPAVLYGSAFLAAFMVLGAIFVGVPAVLLDFLFIKDRAGSKRVCRRVALMGGVGILTILVVQETDAYTPSLAQPIADSVEEFKVQTGVYPRDLTQLVPEYLTELPRVRLAFIQPRIHYDIKDEQAYLAVTSAAGDIFSRHEYLFAEQRWIHY